MNIKNIILILTVFLAILSHDNVFAMSYTTNTDLFENSYSNNLIDMGMSQIDNFINKKYVVFEIDYNYYLVSSKDYTVNGNTITFTNSTVISAIRYQSGYSTYYTYSTSTESSTTVYSNNVVISNIDVPRAISSTRFTDYRFKSYLVYLLVFILGLCFAMFLTKGRSYL